ncbi:DarT ssDNA thymidine ADP-ribosyltransferase family protein [Bengtsoniella intestinalis]|uniref:DarT ssDNA thymidine ADP-ribosyltransferase family protein n=1 Tax=Bengtsoniella intestinalis TaxID=3073143 RepID=UPI00391EEC1F
MGTVKDGKLLYHLTKLSNLESIIDYGLSSRAILEKYKEDFGDIADPEIIDKREAMGLKKYVPFHFHPHTSFDVAVINRYNKEEFVYLCLTRKYAQSNGFCILPRHPLSGEDAQLYSYDDGWEMIDWDVMELKSNEFGYDRNVRMAECLTEEPVFINEFISIAVRNEEIENRVKGLLRKKGVPTPPHVNIQKWLNRAESFGGLEW